MQKKKSGVKKCLEICAIKGGGAGRTPNGKYHLKFPFWSSAPVPKVQQVRVAGWRSVKNAEKVEGWCVHWVSPKCRPCVPCTSRKKWPNQNTKTTFIVQTFPKYGPYGFDLVNLSLLGAILAIFQFCGFSGLFWPFFPCKKCKNENLSPNVNFWSITLIFFLWTPTTHEPEWWQGGSSIQKKCKNGTPYFAWIANAFQVILTVSHQHSMSRF